jgi:metal-responsive CopG/Arc/MetJ family transcriptional regulator
MSIKITVTIADRVESDLREIQSNEQNNNFSEVVEEILRMGIYEYNKKRGEADAA